MIDQTVNQIVKQHPWGERFEKFEQAFKERHKNDPLLLQEVEQLLQTLSAWQIGVFLAVSIERDKRAIDAVCEKLDGL